MTTVAKGSRRRWLLAGLVAVGAGLALAPAANASAFQSPSRNLGCEITSGGVRCDVLKRSFKPPSKPRSCRLDYGHAVSIGRSGRGRFLCAGDTAAGRGRRLAYGRTIRRGRYRCKSLQSGIRCANMRTGHGFALARERYRLF